jgi:hypothetical protein
MFVGGVLAPLLASLFATDTAFARVERFAILAANNVGARDEATLRYAEDDASKLAQVLEEIGGVAPENLLLLRGRDANTFRRALIAFNDRIRARREDPEVEPLLLVYFSGHGDARSLHFGDSDLELGEVEALVRGSAAGYRILLLDACRSGALTKVKGGAPAPPFPIAIQQHEEGEGVVFLTSSSANEESQESEELRGSFFTHYWVTALLGAADQNADGKVSLREAYAFAYEHTLRASSRTWIGLQHPTFDYEVHGKGDLILTDLLLADRSRGMLAFPPARSYLVMQGGSEGPVVAELTAEDRARKISVKPGDYFVRSRGRDALLEGSVTVRAGEVHAIDDRALEEFGYARWVRKGGPLEASDGARAAVLLRGGLHSNDSPCWGALAGYAVDLSWISIAPRASVCRAGFKNEILSANEDELTFDLALTRAFDVSSLFSLAAGLDAGAGVLHQSFGTLGRAPDRWSALGVLGVIGSAEVDLGAGLFASIDLALLTYLLREQGSGGGSSFQAELAPRLAFGAGRRW